MSQSQCRVSPASDPSGLCLLPLSPLALHGSVLTQHRGDGANVLWGVSSGWEPGSLPITSHGCLLSPAHPRHGEGSSLPTTGSALHHGHSPAYASLSFGFLLGARYYLFT